MSSWGLTVSRKRRETMDSSMRALSLKLSTRFMRPCRAVIYYHPHRLPSTQGQKIESKWVLQLPIPLRMSSVTCLSSNQMISRGMTCRLPYQLRCYYATSYIIMTQRICLFDIDGTLTPPRQKIQPDMKECLKELAKVMHVGLVGGSDAKKIRDQLDEETINDSNYFFSENGLVAHKGGQLIGSEAIGNFMGEEKLQKFVNFCLHYIADLNIPVKRGTFIEYRTGLINVSPIGRNCSQAERDSFEQYDKEHQVRKAFIQRLKAAFPDYGLKYSIGGQISFDVFPEGWDKTYCLRFLKDYQEIFFYGDKTYPGGNDHELYEHCRKEGRGFSVTEGPKQTIQLVHKMIAELK